MEIELELTRDDFENFNRYYLFKKGLAKRKYVIIGSILIIPLLLGIGDPFNLYLYLRSVAIYSVVFAAVMYLIYFISLKNTKKLPDKDGSILGKKKFLFSDEGLIEETQYNRNEYSWRGVKSIESNKDYVFIFVDTMAAYIFPKRYFENEAESDNFIKYLNDRIKNAP